MNVKDLYADDLPTSDLSEIVHQLNQVKNDLEEVNDDWTRQEIYDRISMSAIIIDDVMKDLVAIERVMRAVVDG